MQYSGAITDIWGAFAKSGLQSIKTRRLDPGSLVALRVDLLAALNSLKPLDAEIRTSSALPDGMKALAAICPRTAAR